MRKKWILLIIAVLVIAVIGYGTFVTLDHKNKLPSSLTVSSLKAQSEALYGKTVGVTGRVVIGSIESNAQAQDLRFTLSDGLESVPVQYRGVVPDTFRTKEEIVVQGKYRSDGTLEAQNFGRKGGLFCTACHG